MTEESKIEVITASLHEQIKKEEFGTKGRLPSVTQLAKMHQVARSTVYQALLLLQAEGLIVSKDNSFYVNPVIQIETNPTPTFEQILVKQGMQPFVHNVIEPEIIVMPNEVATMFEQPTTGIQVIHRYRVQGKTDVPYRLSEYWYPEHLASKYLQAMKDKPEFDTLEAIKNELGIKKQKVHDNVFARIPTKQEAGLLSIPRNSPVQEVRRTNKSSKGSILMLHRIVFVGPYSMLGYDYELIDK